MFFLSEQIEFPDVSQATEDGLLAMGGDLSPERLIYAYKHGIFPWFDKNQPILWWSPDPRFVLFPEKLKVSKSMKKILKEQDFTITENKAFERVITNCAKVFRKDQIGTWITEEMKTSYIQLNKKGYAKSVEVWKDNELVGGLYGIDLGNGVFCGESMFYTVSNASKIAFIYLVEQNKYRLIDCQIYTKHLESLGAENIPRSEFIRLLK